MQIESEGEDGGKVDGKENAEDDEPSEDEDQVTKEAKDNTQVNILVKNALISHGQYQKLSKMAFFMLFTKIILKFYIFSN